MDPGGALWTACEEGAEGVAQVQFAKEYYKPYLAATEPMWIKPSTYILVSAGVAELNRLREGEIQAWEVAEGWEYHANAVEILMKTLDRSALKELEGK